MESIFFIRVQRFRNEFAVRGLFVIIQSHANLRERKRVLAQADTRAEIHMARSLHEQKESPKGAVLRM